MIEEEMPEQPRIIGYVIYNPEECTGDIAFMSGWGDEIDTVSIADVLKDIAGVAQRAYENSIPNMWGEK